MIKLTECGLLLCVVYYSRIFGPKRDDVMKEWRKLHNEELHNLFSSPDIIRHIKSRRLKWAGHVARMGEERKVWWESPKVRDHSEDQGINGRMGSKWILGSLAGKGWIGSDWLGILIYGELL
jgi:hypothetical protein